MSAASHYMEDGSFLCNYMGNGMVFEAESEDDVSCPDCKKILEARKRKKKMGLYSDDED
jgi:transcription initiation factor IIE alpha subunit